MDPSTALQHHLHISKSTSVTTCNQLTVTSKNSANSVRDGRHTQEHPHHKGLHISGCLGECILEASDGRKSIRNTDENVGSTLDPHAQRRRDWVPIGILTGGCKFAAGVMLKCGHKDQTTFGIARCNAHLIDVVLHDSNPNHRSRTG